MIRSLQCLITGKVQGVMLRAWIFDHANNLGLKGWVRNLMEGKVEVLLQGDEDKIEEMKKRLYQGSPYSKVEDVECKWLDYDKEHTEFQIRS
jgi:acylphosphatase